MENKNAFTLVELLVVIAVLGALTIMGTPLVTKTLKESREKVVKIEEKNMADAADAFNKDYCNKPIDSAHKAACQTYKIKSGNTEYVCMNSLKNLGYLTSNIEYSKTPCEGIVIFEKSSNGKYDEGHSYLICGEKYATESANNYTSLIEACE